MLHVHTHTRYSYIQLKDILDDDLDELVTNKLWLFYSRTSLSRIVPYFGFSSGSGSFLPCPAGCFSASSTVYRCNSASTLPWTQTQYLHLNALI